jgi:hypothetical protein
MSAALVIGVMASAGCTTLYGLTTPRVTPAEIAVAIGRAGPLPPIEVVAPFCDYISTELRFPRSAFASKEQREALIGRGITITMRVSITRIEQPLFGAAREREFRAWVEKTEATEGGATDYVFRLFGGTTLPRGTYRVDAELLEPYPQLEAAHPTFAITSNFKHSPDRAEC